MKQQPRWLACHGSRLCVLCLSLVPTCVCSPCDVFQTQNVDETILYLNARNAEMEAAVAKYTLPPYNIKIMGDEKNYQIAQAMTWLVGNATNEHVLFLEKDFRLVESLDCALEQLDNGVKMLTVSRYAPPATPLLHPTTRIPHHSQTKTAPCMSTHNRTQARPHQDADTDTDTEILAITLGWRCAGLNTVLGAGGGSSGVKGWFLSPHAPP